MGLAHRIIPTILCRGRQLVKGRGFDSWRSVGIAMQAIQVHAKRGVDEVCLLDIAATVEQRGPDLTLVRELSEFLFSPLAVGGGVRSTGDVQDLLRAGADKVVIGTAAWTSDLVRRASGIVGSQAIVVTLDVVADPAAVDDHRPGVRCVREVAPERARWIAEQGAGEILLQSVERDGTGVGYDLELIKAVSNSVDIPVIASGGAGSYQHMLEAIQAGASAVASGAMFQFEDATPRGAAQFLAKAGVEVRL